MGAFVCVCVKDLLGGRGQWAIDSVHDFVIENVSDSDAGYYWCIAENTEDRAAMHIDVSVRDCPPPQLLVRQELEPQVSPHAFRAAARTSVTAVAVAAILTAFVAIALVLACAFARRTLAPRLMRRRSRNRRPSRALAVRDLLRLVHPLKRQKHVNAEEDVVLVDLLLDVLCCLSPLLPQEKAVADGAPAVANLTQVELRPLSKKRVVIMKQVLLLWSASLSKHILFSYCRQRIP